MNISWSNDRELTLLQCYQAEPVIWHPHHKEHKNKNKVNDAWMRISAIMDVPVADLKKKKDSLMSSYRTYKKKIKDSIISSADARDIYKPIWFAYEIMDSFLGEGGESYKLMKSELADAGPDLANSSSVDSLSSVTDKTKFLTNHNQSAKRLKLSTESTENEATSSKESLPSLIPFNSAEKNNVARQIADKSENHFTVISTWCDLLQCKLKEFDEYTREFLMNQIDNYVFRARVKQLKQKKEERKKMEASAGSYVHPVHSIQHVHPLYVDVASTSGLNSNQNRNQDNDKSNVSPTGSHSSLIEIKEERVDIDEEF
ncbi:hypothetical protein HHI36_016139 [Cryptolaemus montrouzieri]|uniref:MADF domain-containing protein n=1 Tax=Cryptolaemus montrouzieri TaxID=559131 RepID=A0ABD2NJI3_9CUCU